MQKNLVVGMLAHVDAGKTTLSEAMLFQGGYLKRLGRVDHQDAFLDTFDIERRRGITVFAKQALLPLAGVNFTLLDTPGHVDFAAEMERTLQVLDYAVLIVNGSDGVQSHTLTLWQLLERYAVPAFLFINKMDLAGTDQARLLAELKQRLHEGCVAFSGRQDQENQQSRPAARQSCRSLSLDEDIAMCGEEALADFLEKGCLSDSIVSSLIQKRRLFPCYFGAALKLEGVTELLEGLQWYACCPDYPEEFGAKVYKISRDAQNNRLTHLKVTGGVLAVKAPLTNGRLPAEAAAGIANSTVNSTAAASPEEQIWTEKVNQIRLYSGEKYQTVDLALPGTICAVTGLNHTYPGQGLGIEPASRPPALEPVLSFRLILPEGRDPLQALRQLRQLEEEDPQLALAWDERSQEIHLNLMGEVQLEILAHLIEQRFGLAVTFGSGNILYRETISGPVIGLGHFEPLRHYAEVHLLLEPGDPGSGLQLGTMCSEDVLPRHWQRLILSHLEEREHAGVLAGAPVTDMKITLLTGKGHIKHTEGGDFRQAAYRALRQGLMQALHQGQCRLLEPWYRFQLEVPNEAVGRAMTDLQRMTDDFSLPDTQGERSLFTGSAPVAALRDYAAEVTAYTRGLGRLACSFKGFAPCHNQEAVAAAIGYEAERDTENPADSVFCSHGAGVIVKWDQVKEHMHLDSGLRLEKEEAEEQLPASSAGGTGKGLDQGASLLDKELRAIYERTYGPVKQRDILPSASLKRTTDFAPQKQNRPQDDGPEYLLVDGYNVIHGWEDLSAIARQSMDTARQLLMDILSNYQGFRKQEIILVFDAYKVPGNPGEVSRYHNISVVYTKEAETADAYIEKVTYSIGRKHRVTVATSDGAIQMIILGHGALRLSPQALRGEIRQADAEILAIVEAGNRQAFRNSIKLP